MRCLELLKTAAASGSRSVSPKNCTFILLSVISFKYYEDCLEDFVKTAGPMSTEPLGEVQQGPRKTMVSFGADPFHTARKSHYSTLNVAALRAYLTLFLI